MDTTNAIHGYYKSTTSFRNNFYAACIQYDMF